MGKLVLVGLAACLAAPVPEWSFPEADGQKWAARIKQAVGRDGWTVEAKGSAIVVRRTAAVAMERVAPNGPPDAKPTPDGERTVLFVLRFAPRVSADEYDRRVAVNAESDKAYDRLHAAVGLRSKFGQFAATTPEEKARVKAFEEEAAKLPRHDLPDLYSPDHGIYFSLPWDGFAYPSDEGVRAECRDVEETLVKLFGVYDPVAARGGRSVGSYRTER